MKPVTSSGVLQDGRPLAFDFADPVHMVVSGRTGSGKSAGLYGFLLQALSDKRVQVWGVDPGQATLAPLADLHPDRFVLGTADGAAVVALLERVLNEMEARLNLLRHFGVDKIPSSILSPQVPAIILVLEEWGGTVTAYDKDQTKIITQQIVPRLLREARKTGISLWTVIQRPEASILPERAQFGRICNFALDNRDSVSMTMPQAAPEDVVWLTSKIPPGQGLLLDGKLGFQRFRSAFIEYSQFAAAVAELGRDR